MSSTVRDAVTVDPYVQQWHIWRAQRLEELKAPHGYLAPVSITWIANGESATIEGVPGSWNARNDVLTYVPDADASLSVSNAGSEVSQALAFVPTAFGEQALGYLQVGDLRVEVNSQTDLLRQELHRFWIRVKDPQAPSRQQFQGIEHFPIAREWSIPATFRRAKDEELDIHDSVVKTVLQSYPVLGFVDFDYQGERYSLVVSNVFGHASIFFSDGTTGKETYGIGRVLQLDALSLDGLDTIPFNYAFKYPCAFTVYCTCPIPSKRNHLPFDVAAGEKAPAQQAIYE